MKTRHNAIPCLLALLLTAAVFLGLLAVNLSTAVYAPEDPALGEAALGELVFLDPAGLRQEDGREYYELYLPEAEHLCVFQPKANGVSLSVNGVPSEYFGMREQNLFMLSLLSPEDGRYRIELSGDRSGNLNDVSLFLGTLDKIISCQSTLFFSRFLALGINVFVGLLALTLYFKKRSETYLKALALFAFLRLFSALYLTVAHVLQRFAPALSGLYMSLYHLSVGQWFSFLFFALLQFRVLCSFAPTRIGRVSLFLPIALASLPMLFFPAGSRGFQLLRLFASGVAALCYLLSLYQMEPGSRFRSAVLAAALALSTASLFFVQLSQCDLVAYGALNLRVHLSILQTCVYPAAYLLIACDRFAEKFREADALNAELEGRIQESTRQHTLFIRSMLHNLKTPLFSLSGYSDMAAASVRTEPARCETFIAKIKENSVYVGHLLDQLFLLTQMDARQVEFQKINVDLSGLLENVCDATRLAAGKKGVGVSSQLEEGLLVYGDALYLQQALQNIADNAVIHTPEGGSITVSAEKTGDGCAVRIADTGCGISTEELPRIFDRYYSNRHGGRSSSGLGLTISKMLIEANGGTVSVESREGQGTCFTVRLPGQREE